MKIVNEHSTLDVDYQGRLEDSSLFDTSIESVAKEEGKYDSRRDYQPLHVTLGQNMLIKGFENALIGMHEGEEKTFNIQAKDAYGEHNPDLIKKFPKDAERDKELKVGMVVVVNLGGREVPARVIEVDEDISFDFNTPLAGKDLNFTVKVVKVED